MISLSPGLCLCLVFTLAQGQQSFDKFLDSWHGQFFSSDCASQSFHTQQRFSPSLSLISAKAAQNQLNPAMA